MEPASYIERRLEEENPGIEVELERDVEGYLYFFELEYDGFTSVGKVLDELRDEHGYSDLSFSHAINGRSYTALSLNLGQHQPDNTHI